MAIYHLRAKAVSRQIKDANGTPKEGTRRSAVAAAAYRADQRLYDNLQGRWFERKHDPDHRVEHTAILAPEKFPDWCFDRQQLWNEVERREVNLTDGKLKATAQLYREVEITLPRELSREQRIALVEKYVTEQFVSEGMIADIAIHNRTASDGQDQPHAHIMLTMRKLEDRPAKLAKGLVFGNKVREWNDSDAQIEQMAEAKRKRGQYDNDIQRFGTSAPLSAALAGAERYLAGLQAATPETDKGQRKKQLQAIKRMTKKVAGLKADIATFGADTRLDVGRRAADMRGEELKKSMRIYQWRAAWAAAANEALESAGEEARIDHRTLAAQRDEAIAEGDWVRAEALNREPQKPMGLAGRISDAYSQVRDNVHRWAAVEMRGKMSRAFHHVNGRDPGKLRDAILRIQNWTEEVIARFNETESPDDLIPEVRRGPRP